jgi:hypothetical protein
MRILILDDEEMRHATYSSLYKGHEIAHVYRFKEFVSCLEHSPQWDLVHLDHDLGDASMADTYIDGFGAPQSYNGFHAMLKLCELPTDSRPKQIIIHSVNPAGAQAMLKYSHSLGVNAMWKPFGVST